MRIFYDATHQPRNLQLIVNPCIDFRVEDPFDDRFTQGAGGIEIPLGFVVPRIFDTQMRLDAIPPDAEDLFRVMFAQTEYTLAQIKRPGWQGHITRTKETILEMAALLLKRRTKERENCPLTLLIQGAGIGYDVPTEDLLRLGFYVVLEDIRPQVLERHRNKISHDLRGRLNCRVRDISGGFVLDLARKIKEWKARTDSDEKKIRDLKKLFEEAINQVEHITWDFDGFDGIASVNLFSTFLPAATRQLEDLLDHPEIHPLYKVLCGRVQQAYCAALQDRVQKGCLITVITDSMIHIVEENPSNFSLAEASSSTLFNPAGERWMRLRGFFPSSVLCSLAQWEWGFDLYRDDPEDSLFGAICGRHPEAVQFLGTTYLVEAVILAPPLSEEAQIEELLTLAKDPSTSKEFERCVREILGSAIPDQEARALIIVKVIRRLAQDSNPLLSKDTILALAENGVRHRLEPLKLVSIEIMARLVPFIVTSFAEEVIEEVYSHIDVAKIVADCCSQTDLTDQLGQLLKNILLACEEKNRTLVEKMRRMANRTLDLRVHDSDRHKFEGSLKFR